MSNFPDGAIGKLRIAHVFRAPLGGLFRHVVDLAGEQTARGHDVGMFFDSGGLSSRVDVALSAIPGGLRLGVETARIRRDPGASDFVALARLGRWISAASPDVVHGHGSKGGALARLTRIAGYTPDAVRAYTPHGGSFNYRPGRAAHRLYMVVERLLAPVTDVFLFESAYIASRFDAEVGDETRLRRIVVNGLRASEFAPVAPNADAAEFVYVGELRAVKGVDVLLEAIARLGARTPAPRLVLVGSGPEKDRLTELARRLGVLDRVSFPGVMSVSRGDGARPYPGCAFAAGVAALCCPGSGGVQGSDRRHRRRGRAGDFRTLRRSPWPVRRRRRPRRTHGERAGPESRAAGGGSC